MKQTVSYLLALFLGLFVGWLGQQFWQGSTTLEPSLSAAQSISRQYQRLNNLKNQSIVSLEEATDDVVSDLTLEKFLNAVNQGNTEQALEYFSQMDSRKLDDVLLLAELMYEQARYELIFSTLYDFRYGLDNKSEQQLLNEIYHFVERVDISLGEKNEYERLVGLYRQLSSLEAEHTFYYLRLSYWLLQSGDTLEASQSLLGAVNDIALEGKIRELQQAIDLYDEVGPQVEVPLKMVGEHYLVNVKMAGDVSVELMIDTGASKTVIKRQLLVNEIPDLLNDALSIEMNTANGRATGLVVNVGNIRIGSLQLGGLDVVLMNLPNFEYDGLLGMNLLSRFDFKIDQENSILILSPKKPVLSLVL